MKRIKGDAGEGGCGMNGEQPKQIGSIVKTVFEDIQRKHEKPVSDSTEGCRASSTLQRDFADVSKVQLTGKDMLAYLSDEIRRRGIGRGKRRKA